MAGTKFSGFTTGATTANTLIVGYDSVAGTNNQYSLAQLKTGLAVSTLYDADGDILASRTINDRAGGFATGAGDNVIKMNVRNSGSFIIAGYLNNGDPGNDNNCIQWGPGTTLGGVNVRGALELSNSGGGGMWLKNNGGTQFLGLGSTGCYTSTTLSVGAAALATEALEVTGNAKITGQGYTELYDTANTTLTVDWNDSNIQELTSLTGSHTFTASNPKAGATYILTLAQTGAVTPTWTGVKWPAATAPTLSGAGKTDIITLICYDATGAGLYYGSSTLNFTT
jgi:hypothetical protein